MRSRRNTARSLTAAMLALGPVLLCQGAYVRRVTPKLPEADGPRQGKAGSGMPLRLLILGDSAAAGVGVATQEQALAGHMVNALKQEFQVCWSLEAQIGATTRSTGAKLKAFPAEAFDVVVISLGVNDVTSGRRVRTWLAELDELAGLLRSKLSVRRMLWSGVPMMHEFPALPQPLRWYLGARSSLLDQVLRSWTEMHADCEFVAAPLSGYGPLMAADGFHPGPQIYARWGAEMAARTARFAHSFLPETA